MKKVLLLSLGLLVGMAGFAQVRTNSENAKKNQLTHVKTNDGTEISPAAAYAPSAVLPSVTSTQIREHQIIVDLMSTMTTNYDLQSNSAIGNRIAAWPDGSVAVTATWDFSGDNTWPERGTGYNYYDGSDFGDEPEARQEPAKSGWPTICAYGNGEILASHNTGVNVYYRATKGQGDWELLTNLQSNGHEWTWPRVACTADGTLHLICADQFTEDGHNVSLITYFRSTDGGHTWTEDPYFNNLSVEYNKELSADDYVIAVNGNRIAVACFSMTYDLFYVMSEDAGLTWEKHIVCEHPYKAKYGQNFDWGQTTVSKETDSIHWNDNSGSIAIGNDGTVHMAWALGRWAPAPESGWGYYSSWYFTPGCVYWNSNYRNEQGTNVIPAFGNWSGDASHPEWVWPGTLLGGHDYTMSYERIQLLEEAAGNGTLHFFGHASEKVQNDPEGPDYDSDLLNNIWGSYRTFDGYSSMPSIALDNDKGVYILYSGLSDTRTGTASGAEYYYRSPFLHVCVGGVWDEWYEATVVATGVAHGIEEAYSVTAYTNEVDDHLWFAYSADDGMGLFLDDDQTVITDNIIYAVRVAKIPDDVTEVKDVVYNIYPNPASDYICISADAVADATITFVNLAGQTVKTINTNLTIGNNSISIDLASGVYFCTVNANGFSKTTKVVVK